MRVSWITLSGFDNLVAMLDLIVAGAGNKVSKVSLGDAQAIDAN